jgi:hypothetical protein
MTLQTMGADFRLAQTALTLEDALERLGVTAIVNEIEPDDGEGDSPLGDAPEPRGMILGGGEDRR